MKRVLILGFVMNCMVIAADAQYLPNSSQAYQFASVYNPAFTGVENYGDLKLGYRYQWTGFGSNAPKFMNIVYNIRLNQPVDLKQNSLRTSTPSGNLPAGKRLIHGLGLSLFNEDVGVINRLGGGA